MILKWIGDLALILFGLSMFRKSMSQAGAFFQNKFLNLPENNVSTLKMLVVTKLCAFSQSSISESQYGAVALLNSRAFSKHYAVLLLCLSVVGLWTTLFGALVMWQFEGAWLLALGVIFYLTNLWFGKGEFLFRMFLGLGILCWGALHLMQDQAAFISTLGESELHFLLADGRFPAQLAWVLVAFLITLLVRVESWSVFFSIGAIAAGSLSLNGAVGFIAGELLAQVWILAWQSRRLNKDTRQIAKSYAVASSAGILIGFVLAGLLRTVFSWGYEFETNELTNRVWQFLSMYFLVIISQMLVSMIWGHFSARKKLDEVQTGEYFSAQWIRQGLISKSVLDFVFQKLNLRLALLLAQKKSLTATELEKVPLNFRRSHEHEIAQLTMWLPKDR
jgi:Na+/phosphate symporter